MGRPSGVGVLVATFVTHLRAVAALTALVPAARIVADVPVGFERPYVLVEHVTETDDDTLSLGGVDAVVSTTIVSDYQGAKQIGQIASALREALDGEALVVAGFSAPADVSYEQAIGEYLDDIANVKVRHRPLWFRVRAL
jgi:hypothetical protein